MLRLTLFVLAMWAIFHTPETLESLSTYKDYVLAVVLVILLKPWLENQFD